MTLDGWGHETGELPTVLGVRGAGASRAIMGRRDAQGVKNGEWDLVVD